METGSMSRRNFIRFGAIGAAGAATASFALSGCAPRGQASANASGASSLSGSAVSSANVEWTEETDVVVVGSGTAIFGAMLAKKAGKEVVVLEKAPNIGGTLFYSGFGMWVPNNHLMAAADWATKDSVEDAVTYLKNCDVFHSAIEGQIEEWVERVPEVFRYLDEELDFPLALHKAGDYYTYGGTAVGRSLVPDYGKPITYASYQDNSGAVTPLVESSGLDIRLETPATHLVQDENGAIIGVIARDKRDSEIASKARSGVILASGSFDHNPAMRKAFLPLPLVGSHVPPENTGDGHIMGMEIGADFNNMHTVIGSLSYVLGEDSFQAINADGDTKRPNTVVVNRAGHRFGNESYDYHQSIINMRSLDFSTTPPTSCADAFLIADARLVADYGYPGGNGDTGTCPEFVHEYETLEALAEGEGIDAEGLLAQVERFNGFCESGIDEEFHRGEGGYETNVHGAGVYAFVDRSDLKNPYLGPISQPPFIAAKIGAASFGTTGGLRVNIDGQVLRNNEPIPGLYACGCTTGLLVDSHPGFGSVISNAISGGMFAANKMLDLNLF